MNTRNRILDAAAQLLAEEGWSAASVSEVAKRAGVTRGAVQHHFTDREGLFTVAIEYVLENRVAEFHDQAKGFPAGPGRTLAVVRTVVEQHQGASFAATLQLCVAAHGEPALRPRVAAMEAEMGAKYYWALIELLRLDGSDPKVRTTVQAFLDSARGLGLAGFIGDDSRRRERVTRRWAEMIDELSA
ncbi:TetR family transcriptional regulator [Nocardia stercoris]|uniref:TetR family transcriptional regulator n=1 Tax=Nocardia stercoris TaxID=2483361 RepID=A0A3M2L0I1_9NOCA|nr:TetR family transcriptional regulator [Nocardia stercoris]